MARPSDRATERRCSTERERVVTSTHRGRAELAGGPLVVSTIGRAGSGIWAAVGRYWETLGVGPWRVYRQGPPGRQEMR